MLGYLSGLSSPSVTLKHDNLVIFTPDQKRQGRPGCRHFLSSVYPDYHIKIIDRMADHVRIEVTTCSRVYLFHRNPGRGNAYCIVVRLLITLDDGETVFSVQVAKGPFQDRCFARARRTYQIQDKNSFLLEHGAVSRRKPVILGEDIGFNADRFRSGPIVIVMLMLCS
jgi:hypothetical protein